MNRQMILEGGLTGFYAYIGTEPSSQIQDVYTAGCHEDANCTATVMRGFKIEAPDFVKKAWYTAWSVPYDIGEAGGALYQIAVNRWVSGGQLNTCLVLVKPTFPYVLPDGTVLTYRWQTRALYKDGCRYGEFAS